MRLFLLFLISLPALAQPLLLDTNFPAGSGPDDYVRAIAVQPDQRIFVAGNFSTFSGFETGPLVRLLPNGTLDPEFQPVEFRDQYSSPRLTHVEALADGRILVNGSFTNAGGRDWTNVAVLRADGSADPSFNLPRILPREGFISFLSPAPDGGFWATGRFTNIGGLNISRIARLRGDGSVDPSFQSPFGPNEFDATSVLPLPDGRLVISGTFSNIAGMPVPGIARLLPSSAIDPAFQPNFPGPLSLSRLVLMPNGSLVGAVSRSLQNFLEEPATLMRLQPNGQVDQSFSPEFIYGDTYVPAYNRILVMEPEPNGNLLVAGTFLSIDGQVRYGLARLLPDGSVDPCFDPGLGPSQFLLGIATQQDGSVLIGGIFRAVEGQHRPYLARLNANSDCGPGRFSFASAEFVANESSPSALLTVVREGSVALAESVQMAFLGGSADASEDYQPINHVLDFAPGERAKTASLFLRADTLVEGEETVHFSLFSRNGVEPGLAQTVLRIVDPPDLRGSGEVDPAFRPAIDAPVSAALSMSSGDWLFAVAPTNTAGYASDSSSSLRLMRADGSLDLAFGTNSFDGEIRILAAQPDGRFLAAGWFERVNGVLRPGLARFDASGNFDPGFDPFADHYSSNTYINPVVLGLTVNPDGSIICAGELPEALSSTDRFRLFKILPNGALDESFHADQERHFNGARALARLPDGSLIAGFGGESAAVGAYSPEGRRDPRFIPPPYYPTYTETLDVLPDGSVIAAGGPTFGLQLPILARLAHNGGPITPFTANAGFSFDLERSSIYRLRAQPDGRSLAAGTIQIGASPARTTVVRLNADGSWDHSFDAGAATPRLSTFSEEITPRINTVEPFPGGGWLVGGDFGGFGGLPQPFLVRLLASDSRSSAIRFADSQWQIDESAGSFLIDVARTGSAETNATVRVTSVPGSALPHVHFQPLDVTLEFAPSEWLKRIRIDVRPNALADGNHTFRIALASSNAALGNPNSAEITIVDDDVNLEFIADAFTAIEGEPFARIGVRRVGVPGEPVSVFLESSIGPARIDFPSTSEDGAVTNYVNLPVPDDAEYRPGREVVLHLSVPSGKASLGPTSTAILRILENDYSTAPGRGAAGPVNVVLPAANGGVYLAGDFTAIHGLQRNRVARLLPNGEVDPAFDPGAGPNAAVTALALDSQSRVLIGGYFTQVNGEPRMQLARLNSDGSLDPAFNPGSGAEGDMNFPAQILALAANSDHSFYVGGRFREFQGYAFQGIVRLHENGALDTTFHSPLTSHYSSRFPFNSLSTPSAVSEIHHRTNDSILIVGDLFTAVQSGWPITYDNRSLLALLPNGDVDTNFTSTAFSIATLCPLSDGGWLAGTSDPARQRTFPKTMAATWVAIHRLHPNGRLDTNFVVRGAPDIGASSSVIRKIMRDSAQRIVFIAEIGSTNIGSFGRSVVARLLPDGSWDENFRLLTATNLIRTTITPKYPLNDPPDLIALESSASIHSIAEQTDGTLVSGGVFTEINGEPRRRLARINSDGTLRGRLELSIELTPDAPLHLQSSPEVEPPYVVQRSADLLQWEPILTNSTPWIPVSLEPMFNPSERSQYFRAVTLEP